MLIGIKPVDKKKINHLYQIDKKMRKGKIEITSNILWKLFKITYKIETGKEFEETDESLKNISPIIKYFAYDDEFFECDRLVSEFNNPSFDKGLLIIGNYGNGKTSIMTSLSKMTIHYKIPIRFQYVNANQLVTEWETIQSPGEKSLFFEKYLCKCLYIDDVKKEKTASNYGKTEVIKEILEKRYDKKLRTLITCNYRDSDNSSDLSDALIEFNRYGNHIYDRLFEMFNIIEFKGKSFRK